MYMRNKMRLNEAKQILKNANYLVENNNSLKVEYDGYIEPSGEGYYSDDEREELEQFDSLVKEVIDFVDESGDFEIERINEANNFRIRYKKINILTYIKQKETTKFGLTMYDLRIRKDTDRDLTKIVTLYRTHFEGTLPSKQQILSMIEYSKNEIDKWYNIKE